MMKKQLPLTAKLNIALQQRLSFSPLFGRIYQPQPGSIGFFPGCSLCEYHQELALRVYRYLQELFPDIALVTLCCAEPSRALGEKTYRHYRRRLQQQLSAAGIKRLIVCCPNCQKNFAAGTDCQMTTLWEVLDQQLPPQKTNIAAEPFMLHDPCPCRCDRPTQDHVRSILEQLHFPYQEYSRSREQTICCGNKDMLMLRDPQASRRLRDQSINRSDNRHILSYCCSCVTAFRAAGCQSMHLLEAVFPDIAVSQAPRSLWRAWANRLSLLRRVKQ